MPKLDAAGLGGWTRMAKIWAKIHEINSGFTLKSSSLKEVLEAVAQGGPNLKRDLQTALDKVPVEKAKKYKAALQLLVDDYPDVCYTGVEDFSTTSNSKGQPPSSITDPSPGNRRVRYTSAEFMAKAKVYWIVSGNAATPFEVGFIQHCTAKSDVAEYSNGSKMEDHCTMAMPVGDSAGPAHAPFYFKGTSHGCTEPCHRQLAAGEGNGRFEIGDYFNNNFQFYHPRPTATALDPTVVFSKGRRDQAFELWLARVNGTDERLLRRVTYRIVVDTSLAGTAVRCSSSVKDISVTKPDFSAQRPTVSAADMNNYSRWRYCPPNSAAWTFVS